jgi:hypothetical protein
MSARLTDLAGLPDWPLMLSAEQAAAYCGVSRDTFAALVDAKVLPEATKLPIRRKLWNRDALKEALAKRSPAANDWRQRRDEWRKRQDRAAGAG